ncbi:NAD binding Rossmann fold oxidoreductase [Tuber magnatum]|uniref:D-xylose 1-dehydrogenase (NADP(+), D-xylono-1,5-lactone-forming) n=1 Tax=Tuber magnatum TaxID=42249 RepID=A0A317SZB1_9PEZI|nr:NAD binding Rossmann fold oxidoreductase [Tuber magnatum]
MAMALQISTFLHQYIYGTTHAAPKSPNAIRFGILSTAMINPAAMIRPAETHPEVEITAIASRDLPSAKKYAAKYRIKNAYGSYDELLGDPTIQAVYISLPNGMHGEWAERALNAGKHVLLEKPLTANASEARRIFEIASAKNLVLLEAFHWQFHPAAHVVHSLVHSGRYGQVMRTYARMTTPAKSIPKSDIRWKYDLAGGSLMDMAYVVSATRYFLDKGVPTQIVSAKARRSPEDGRIDEAMEAELRWENDEVKSKIYADMKRGNVAIVVPRVWELPSIEIECEDAVIYFYNFMMPHLYHHIQVTDKKTGHKTTQKHYNWGPKWGVNSEPWWSTYRYQLEAFADRLQGRQPAHWIDPQDSIDEMQTIDMIYEKSGLGIRHGTSEKTIIAGKQ